MTASVILIYWLSTFPLLVPNNNWEIDWNIFIQHKVLLWQSSCLWTGGTRWKDGSNTVEILFHLIDVQEWGLSVTSFGMLGAPHAIMRAVFCELRKLELSGLSLGLYHSQFFFLKEIFLSRDSVKWNFHQKKITLQWICLLNHSSGTFFPWVYALIYIVYHFL